MSIGEFAKDSRLSPNALRLYDEVGLLPPARVDKVSPAEIKAILPLEPAQAADRVREVWAATEAEHTARRALAAYVIDELSGKRSVMYEVGTRDIPQRALLCVKRNVAGVDQAWAFGKEFIALLRRYQLPQIPGRVGAFFCIYWGEVSADSDGPMEWCRPVPPDEAEALARRCPELTLRAEPAHQEAFVSMGDGHIDGADMQVVSRSLETWSEHQPDILRADLGVRNTYLPSEVGQGTYQDFAVPFNGHPRG